MPQVTFQPSGKSILIPAGTPLLQAAEQAGIEIVSPCGTKGNCGKCLVRILEGTAETTGASNLSKTALNAGFIQACRSVVGVETLEIEVPPQHVRSGQFADISRDLERLEPDLLPQPSELNPLTISCHLDLSKDAPAEDLPDIERLTIALQKRWGEGNVTFSLPVLQKAVTAVRDNAGRVTARLRRTGDDNRVIDLVSGHLREHPCGLAIDIGTTTVSVQLVSLPSGEIVDTRTEYNGQVACGADIISRINFAARPENLSKLTALVLETVNRLIRQLADEHGINPVDLHNIAVSGNTTMTHLLLGLSPEYIRLEPYTPAILEPPILTAGEIGFEIHPEASVYLAPAAGSYIGGDIAAGLLCTTMDRETDEITLFIDIGTNGELAVGNSDFIMACACSAGPAFEGGGIQHGMRAARGAIESVAVDPETGTATVKTIGDASPLGICGSGIISLIAELFRSGWMDPAGKLNRERPSPAVEVDKRQAAYVIGAGDGKGQEIRISEAEFENVIRAKAAIYSAVSLLLNLAEIEPADIGKVYIAGGFGHFLNLDDAVCIGLLPDIPREKYRYIGNSSLTGSYMALVSRDYQKKQQEIGRRITYIELSTDPAYMDQYTAALFLPHTDLSRFPSAV